MGLLAALPYLVMAVVVQSAGQLADYLRTRFKISTTIVKLQIILMNQIILLIKPHLLGKKSVYQRLLYHPDELPTYYGSNDTFSRFGTHLSIDCSEQWRFRFLPVNMHSLHSFSSKTFETACYIKTLGLIFWIWRHSMPVY